LSRLKVRVIPNARKTQVGGYREDELILRLNAPALEGKANKAAIEFLSKVLDVPRSAVALISGEKSRHKVFEIGLSGDEIRKKLEPVRLES